MYHQISDSDTIFALSTPEGRGAIAVVRLSGAEVLSICNRFFFPKNKKPLVSHLATFGELVAPNSEGQVLDEVLLTYFKAPKSYTGEDIAEIACHASPFIVQEVLNALAALGARLATPGEFTKRAFLNQKLDLVQAEAVADLIASETASQHRVALVQMRGGFSGKLAELRGQLIHFAALLELELDFSEENVEFAKRSELVGLIETMLAEIKQAIETFSLGNAIKNGIPTAIIGRPNAGKSTLLNALLQEDRAIVSNIPGTTRDAIEEVLNIKGIPFRIIDTAGIRKTDDQIESIGIAKTFQKIEQAAVILYLFELNLLSLDELKKDLEVLAQHSTAPILMIGTKNDLVTDLTSRLNEIMSAVNQPLLTTSLLHQPDLEPIKEKILELSGCNQFNQSGTIVSNTRHKQALINTQTALERSIEGLENEVSSEFVAFDIRQALHYLGEITGQIEIDKDILGTIFGKFCIGK
jgi:tRNA modification GTPase